MSADELLRLVSQALFVLIFLVVATRAIRVPLRANIDVALLFSVPALLVVEQWLVRLGVLPASETLSRTGAALLLALPYLLLRLVDDFAAVAALLLHGAAVGLALAVATLLAFGVTAVGLPLYVLYFTGLQAYAATIFVNEGRRASGVTRRRMEAAAFGSLLLGTTILFAALERVSATLAPLWDSLSQVAAMASGLGYLLAFAPPPLLRRAWEAPELRALLGRAASLPRLPGLAEVVRELEQGAAASLGAPRAAIGLWDEAAAALRFSERGLQPLLRSGELLSGRAFASQRPLFSDNPPRDDPEHAAVYLAAGAGAVLAVPISAGERRLGVLEVTAPRAPVFAEDSLALARLLADQAAVILEGHAMMQQAARLHAREEADRLKHDFLSSAAHELKTPLTTLVAQAQLLKRRATLNPQAPMDAAGIERLVRESRRLTGLILELLDAAQLEPSELLGPRERVDLAEIAREACERQRTPRHRFVLETPYPVTGHYDRRRILQAVEHLVENATKYSPEGGEVRVTLWREGDEARLSVADSGIGIPAQDLPHLFERYHRGANVDDRQQPGMGIGLFLTRLIVEQHGGRIWATSVPGRGSTFHIALPAEHESSADV